MADHEYEECFGNVTAMCRALFRTGALYDAGPSASALHRHAFPLPGGWLHVRAVERPTLTLP